MDTRTGVSKPNVVLFLALCAGLGFLAAHLFRRDPIDWTNPEQAEHYIETTAQVAVKTAAVFVIVRCDSAWFTYRESRADGQAHFDSGGVAHSQAQTLHTDDDRVSGAIELMGVPITASSAFTLAKSAGEEDPRKLAMLVGAGVVTGAVAATATYLKEHRVEHPDCRTQAMITALSDPQLYQRRIRLEKQDHPERWSMMAGLPTAPHSRIRSLGDAWSATKEALASALSLK